MVIDTAKILAMVNPFNKVAQTVIGAGSLADQLVVDKDAKLGQEHEMDMEREESYQVELATQTLVWVDALHKMGRQLLSLLSMIFGFVIAMYAISKGMDGTAIVSTSAGIAPGAIYNNTKTRDKIQEK